MADYSFLDLVPHYSQTEAELVQSLGLGAPMLNKGGQVVLSHIVWSSLAFVIILGIAFVVRGKFTNKETAIVPEGKFSLRNFVEVFFGAILGMMTDMMGEKKAKEFFPLIATLGLWIFVSNFMGLVPGLAPPTSNLNTNLAPALMVFITYNIAGMREHGVFAYLKHFLGPVLFIAPLMLVIELIGHAFRPVSLGVRLTGNMTGDHMVLGAFGDLATSIMSVPALLPLPFLALGTMVCTIQTLVFCLLSSVYISLAVEHADH
jgi:F-type H+-transporting ATPase subunit a